MSQLSGHKSAHSYAQLMTLVAEELKAPLTAIARNAELASLKGDFSPDMFLEMVRVNAGSALDLIDSYILGLQLSDTQTMLNLEPISLTSVLNDTAHELYGFARQYDVSIELNMVGNYGPVISNQAGLKAALGSLGTMLIEHCACNDENNKNIVIAAHKSDQNVITGIYSSGLRISADQWHKALQLYGNARHPLSSVMNNSGGIFVARTILRAMSSDLRTSKYQKRSGLAATIPLSKQLQLV